MKKIKKITVLVMLAAILSCLAITPSWAGNQVRLQPGWWYFSIGGRDAPGGVLWHLPKGAGYFKSNMNPATFMQRLSEEEVHMAYPYYDMPKYFAGGQDVWLEHCLQSPYMLRRPPMSRPAPACYYGGGGYVPPNGTRYRHREPGFERYAYIIIQDRALGFVDRSAHEGFRRLFREIFDDGARPNHHPRPHHDPRPRHNNPRPHHNNPRPHHQQRYK
ncbi:MAG: hypothetical protein LBI74_11170 [Synergistaceae bacterium]|nr:hypothetical protein [Synergistaceae bacterium]